MHKQVLMLLALLPAVLVLQVLLLVLQVQQMQQVLLLQHRRKQVAQLLLLQALVTHTNQQGLGVPTAATGVGPAAGGRAAQTAWREVLGGHYKAVVSRGSSMWQPAKAVGPASKGVSEGLCRAATSVCHAYL